jgi:hypothetical protein
VTEPPIIRTSERRKFKRCMQAWEWAYRYGLKGKFREADALWFGTGIHEALAQWYKGPGLKRGMHPAKYWDKWVGDEMAVIRTAVNIDPKDDVWVDARKLGIAMMEGYVERYGKDPTWDVIAPEESFQIDIPFRNKEGVAAIYAGTFDLVYRDLESGEILLGEHKTAKTISTRHLSLDDQAGAYWAVASKILQHRGVLKKGDSIKGIMYNFMRKGLPDIRPENEEGQKLNKDGSVSKNQPAPLYYRELVPRTRSERITQLQRIQDEAAWMDIARRHPDRIMKTPDFFCAHTCEFFDMCELHEKGGPEWKEYRDAMFTVRDPYADHRKSANE